MKKIVILLISVVLFAEDLSDLRLFKVAEIIGGRDIICNGHDYIMRLDKYKQILNEAYNDKELYKKPVKDYEKYYDYFKYWAYQSLGNKRLFDEFNLESAKFCEEYKNHFINLSNMNYKQSCDNFIQIIGMRAFGSITKFVKLDKIYEEFLELDSEDAIAFLNGINLNYYELEFLLKIALLSKKNLDVINFLIQNGSNLNSGYESAIFYALDYYEALQLLIKNGANVNYSNSFGKTPIFYAVENNNIEAIKLLIKNGANLNVKLIDNEDILKVNLPYYISICSYIHPSKTLVIHTSIYGNLDILKLLIKNGADYKEKDNTGLDALYYAKIYNNKDIVAYLKELGLKDD